jgi:hypothetical protein
MRSPRRLAAAVAIVVAAILASDANAEERLTLSSVSMPTMLRLNAVQEELKLTADQTESVTKILRDDALARIKLYEVPKGLSAKELQSVLQRADKQMLDLQQESYAKLTALLKPEQLARMNELALQERGLGALSEAKVAAALKLSDDQKKKLAELAPPRGATPDGGPPNVGEFKVTDAASIALDRARHEAKVMDVLTASQREQFNKMRGRKFDWDAQ